MISCREFIDFLMDYLDEELAERERERFEAHLAVCPDCLGYLGTYKQTIALTADACEDGDDLPEDVPEDLIKAILAARKRR